MDLNDALSAAYDGLMSSEVAARYMERHGVAAQPFLTVTDDSHADMIAERLADRIAGKTVVEIGGGIGLLALHMGFMAKRVYCIDVNPVWASSFVSVLMAKKPRNVSFLFGAADEFVGAIKGDVAVYCTHSDVKGMGLVAAQFAPIVVDVYGEMIASNPAAFDATAVATRPFA